VCVPRCRARRASALLHASRGLVRVVGFVGLVCPAAAAAPLPTQPPGRLSTAWHGGACASTQSDCHARWSRAEGGHGQPARRSQGPAGRPRRTDRQRPRDIGFPSRSLTAIAQPACAPAAAAPCLNGCISTDRKRCQQRNLGNTKQHSELASEKNVLFMLGPDEPHARRMTQ
jgi:hypothetical protein